jgi:hypothetical protein
VVLSIAARRSLKIENNSYYHMNIPTNFDDQRVTMPTIRFLKAIERKIHGASLSDIDIDTPVQYNTTIKTHHDSSTTTSKKKKRIHSPDPGDERNHQIS